VRDREDVRAALHLPEPGLGGCRVPGVEPDEQDAARAKGLFSGGRGRGEVEGVEVRFVRAAGAAAAAAAASGRSRGGSLCVCGKETKEKRLGERGARAATTATATTATQG